MTAFVGSQRTEEGAPAPNERLGRHGSGDRGQATVELALCLPFVATALLLVVQVGLVAHTEVLVVHAAREAARAAAVGAPVPPPDGLDPSRTSVVVEALSGGRVRATVRYRTPTDVPLVGPLVGDLALAAEATMRDERSSGSQRDEVVAGRMGSRR
jgi:hypothetical protein